MPLYSDILKQSSEEYLKFQNINLIEENNKLKEIIIQKDNEIQKLKNENSLLYSNNTKKNNINPLSNKTIYFTDFRAGADKTICFTDFRAGADKTICFTDFRAAADKTICITDYSTNADKTINIADYSVGADKTICITDFRAAADITICITDFSAGADKTICITKNPAGADYILNLKGKWIGKEKIIVALLVEGLLE